MRTSSRVAGLLLAAILAFASQTAHLPLRGGGDTTPVPTHVLHSVRESLAAIDQFIVDGDLAALWQTLDRVGHGLDPWPDSALADRDRVALAFRATFPSLHLDLGSITPKNGEYAVRLKTTSQPGAIPAWLDADSPPSFPDPTTRLVSIDEYAIQRVDDPLSATPLFASVPDPGIPFLLTSPSHLFAVRITLTPALAGSRYLSVAGPALVAPQTESLRIEGGGQLLVLRPGQVAWRRLIANESTVAAGGDLVYVPSGYAILTMTTPEPATFIFFGVAGSGQPHPSTDEDGRPAPPDLAQLASSAPASPTTAWFGTIEAAHRSNQPVAPGMNMLDISWLVLPPGASVRESPQAPAVVVACSGIGPAEAFITDGPSIENVTDRTLVLLVIRAVSG